MNHLLVDASGDVNSDPLVVAERDRVDGVLDGLEVGAPVDPFPLTKMVRTTVATASQRPRGTAAMEASTASATASAIVLADGPSRRRFVLLP